MFNLNSKTAIVTGALGLLGKNHCKALYNSGANVIVADIDKKKCDEFAIHLGTRARGYQIDVRDKSNLQNILKLVLKEFKSIDILVNNAAINDMFENPNLALENSKFENYPLEMWNKMFEVNVTGIFLACQVFGTQMAKQRKGSIINISSTYGVVAPVQNLYKDENGSQVFYKSAAYPSTKAAVISLTKYLAAYWGSKGVRVNSLSPGGVENKQEEFFINSYSERTLLGRMAKPNDYMGAIIFLASDESAYMTGSNLIVDGGWTAI